MNRKLLITGGSGYLGERLILHAVPMGWAVASLDINPPEDSVSGVEYLVGDVLDADFLKSALIGATHIVHTVAHVPLKKSNQKFEEVNIEGTRNVLRLALSGSDTKKTVVVSSSAVYGVPLVNPVRENNRFQPFEPYGKSKADSEIVVREFVNKGLDVTIIRPRTILGAGRLGIFGTLFDWVLSSAPLPVIEGGRNKYQFVHVDDLARAILLALDKPGPDEFNVGSSDALTMLEYMELLIQDCGSKSQVFSINKMLFQKVGIWAGKSRALPFAPYQLMMFGESMWFDVSKAKSGLGWHPQHTSAESLIDSFRDFRNSRKVRTTSASPHLSIPNPGLLRQLKPLAQVLNWVIHLYRELLGHLSPRSKQ
jgi:nucleoside-diphosphate-sugar epimerase